MSGEIFFFFLVEIDMDPVHAKKKKEEFFTEKRQKICVFSSKFPITHRITEIFSKPS